MSAQKVTHKNVSGGGATSSSLGKKVGEQKCISRGGGGAIPFLAVRAHKKDARNCVRWGLGPLLVVRAQKVVGKNVFTGGWDLF